MLNTDHNIILLFYGDYPQLAQRCIDGLLAHTEESALRGLVKIGLNEVCEETRRYVYRAAAKYDWHVLDSHSNIKKYPMMRELFYHSGEPIDHKNILIWFDDDSYPSNNRWLSNAYSLLAQADMVGISARARMAGNQHLWVEHQPWYNGKSLAPNQEIHFIVGGWWAIKSKILSRFQWPPLDLCHCGGDVMLGELLRQHNYSLAESVGDICVNADDAGRSGEAPRRGFREEPVGTKYVAASKQNNCN